MLEPIPNSQQWERGPRIVAIGGGTGLSTMLRGLKNYTRNLTAVVTVADDGGGSGMLRRDMGMPPPGDIRHCMESLANVEPIMQRLLTYRFTEGALAGQSFGNLILAALNGVTGSFEEAVSQMSQVLAITGRVIPVTSADVQLEAVFENGTRVVGESKIYDFKKQQDCRIHHVALIPERPRALPSALEAIREADLILLGPGSLYTSVIPNLLVKGVPEAIAQSDALKIYVCNIMTQDGETEGYTAGDHLEALMNHGAPGLLDLCLANSAPVQAGLVERYRAEDAVPLAVARELDIYRPGDLAVTGAELEFLPQEALEEDIHRFSVFARVSPEHKMRIVKAWQKRGCVVAMTGDGVNDAPALKAADIGCAMGRSGTDVAKGAADLILTDDNFSTIVSAIEEGRGIWSNIRKAIHYLLSCNIGEILTIFTATLLDFGQMPLAPVQLLWLNLVTDSLPALALGVEPVEEGAMEQPPRPADRGLFDRSFSLRLAWQGLMVGGLTLAAYFLGFTRLAAPGLEGAVANTMAFATLTLCQLFHAFNVRSEDRSLLEQGLLSNPAMNKAFLAGASMQLAVLLFPPLQSVFSVVPMDGGQWLTVLLLAAAPIPICELAKALGRRREMAETRGVPPDHGTGRPVSGAGAAK